MIVVVRPNTILLYSLFLSNFNFAVLFFFWDTHNFDENSVKRSRQNTHKTLKGAQQCRREPTTALTKSNATAISKPAAECGSCSAFVLESCLGHHQPPTSPANTTDWPCLGGSAFFRSRPHLAKLNWPHLANFVGPHLANFFWLGARRGWGPGGVGGPKISRFFFSLLLHTCPKN